MVRTTRPKAGTRDDATNAVDLPEPVVTPDPETGQPAADAVTPTEMPPPDLIAKLEAPPDQPSLLPPTPSTPPPPPKQSSGLVGMVLGGVIAAALGYGVATFAPLDGMSDQAALTEAQASLAVLADRIASLEVAPEPVPDTTLADRVQALETAAPVATDLVPVTDQVAALDARIASLEAADSVPDSGGGADTSELSARINTLRAEFEALKGSGADVAAQIAAAAAEADARLADAEAQATQLKAEAEETARKALARAAVGRLQAALESGAPFATALRDLRDMDVPASLTEAAETGIPSQSELEDAFPPAARAALEVSLQAEAGASWTQRLGSFVQSTTGARSLTPRDGTDPDAVLSRAEAALKAGDLDRAVNELTGLPVKGQAAMAGFTALVNTRRDAVQSVGALSDAIEG